MPVPYGSTTSADGVVATGEQTVVCLSKRAKPVNLEATQLILGVILDKNAECISDSVQISSTLRVYVAIALMLTLPTLWIVFNFDQIVEMLLQWKK